MNEWVYLEGDAMEGWESPMKYRLGSNEAWSGEKTISAGTRGCVDELEMQMFQADISCLRRAVRCPSARRAPVTMRRTLAKVEGVASSLRTSMSIR